MAHQLPHSPNITAPTHYVDVKGIAAYLVVLYRDLIRVLNELSYHINNTVDLGGHDRMEGPFGLASYTVATVPDATEAIHVGALIFISNEAGGPCPAYSDGTNWRRFSDGAIVS